MGSGDRGREIISILFQLCNFYIYILILLIVSFIILDFFVDESSFFFWICNSDSLIMPHGFVEYATLFSCIWHTFSLNMTHTILNLTHVFFNMTHVWVNVPHIFVNYTTRFSWIWHTFSWIWHTFSFNMQHVLF